MSSSEEKTPFVSSDLLVTIQDLVEATATAKIESLESNNAELQLQINALEERIQTVQGRTLRSLENRVTETESSLLSLDQEGRKSERSQEHQLSRQLTENTFSLIYTLPLNSVAFFGCLLITLFQFCMPLLTLLDQLHLEYPENPFLVPTDVSVTVRLAGFMALIFSVPLYWDLMDSIEKLAGGPPSKSKRFGGATIPKFYFAFSLQFVVGAFFQITIFTLIVQSSTVIGMFLNFAALQFITEVDDIAFALAARGYLGRTMKHCCLELSDHELPMSSRKIFIRRFFYFFITTVLLTGYSFLYYQQQNGAFNCKRLEVQFGDGFISVLPLFSGFYVYEHDIHDGRPIYREETTGRSAFRYCQVGQSGYWVFNYIRDDIQSIDDMCKDWVSRSPYTGTYGILSEDPNHWLVKKFGHEVLEYGIDYFGLHCVDCGADTCNGRCEDNVCVCDEEGQFGSHCQFVESPCEVAEYDHRKSQFSGDFLNDVSSRFQLLIRSDGIPAQAYGRPIYVYVYPDPVYNHRVDVLMFLGRRYFILGLLINESDLVDYLENIHPFYDWILSKKIAMDIFDDDKINFNDKTYNSIWFHDTVMIEYPLFVSESIDLGTESDSFSPIGLTWNLVDASRNDKEFDVLLLGPPVDSVLLCAACSDSIPCMNAGICGSEGNNNTCSCLKGFEGPLCEKNMLEGL